MSANTTDPASTSDHPLHQTRPPALDYLTYLTLIETQLEQDPSSIAVLEDILKADAAQTEPKLLINIGWDLIATLLPHLPASKGCLDYVAQAGNPRECVLKASEALGLLIADWDGEDAEADADGIAQFATLTAMLGTLHARIRTKRPSRFVTATVTPLLRAVGDAGPARLPGVVEAVLALFGALRPRKGPPALPPRQGSTETAARPRAPDPEADAPLPEQGEAALIDRLLDSAETFAVAVCAEAFDVALDGEAPGFGWSAEALDRFSVNVTMPGREGWADRFRKDDTLLSWRRGLTLLVDSVLGRVGADKILQVAMQVVGGMQDEVEAERLKHWTWSEDYTPEKIEDVKLSPQGCLHVLAVLFQREPIKAPSITIFPTVQSIFDAHLPSSSPATVDSLLSLALYTLTYAQQDKSGVGLGDLPENTDFVACLQTTSALAATATVPALRQTAHVLTSTLLRSHPEPGLRMAFIKEAIAAAPFDNLRPVAVGWLKGEIVEANAEAFRAGMLAGVPRHHVPGESEQQAEDERNSLFATPLPLHALSSVLFPDVAADVLVKAAPMAQRWQSFQSRVGLYLAVLNLYYLLLSAPKSVRERLDVGGLHRDADVAGSFLGGLRDAVRVFRIGLGVGDGEEKGALVESEGEEGVQRALAELSVAEDGLERIEGLIKRLGSDM